MNEILTIIVLTLCAVAVSIGVSTYLYEKRIKKLEREKGDIKAQLVVLNNLSIHLEKLGKELAEEQAQLEKKIYNKIETLIARIYKLSVKVSRFQDQANVRNNHVSKVLNSYSKTMQELDKKGNTRHFDVIAKYKKLEEVVIELDDNYEKRMNYIYNFLKKGESK